MARPSNPPSTAQLSRRAVLRGTGMLGAGVGISGLLAACGIASPDGGAAGSGGARGEP